MEAKELKTIGMTLWTMCGARKEKEAKSASKKKNKTLMIPNRFVVDGFLAAARFIPLFMAWITYFSLASIFVQRARDYACVCSVRPSPRG